MANKRLLVRIGLATAILVAGASLMRDAVPRFWRPSSSDPGDITLVLVADHYIPAFTPLRTVHVRAQEYPKALVPPGALRDRQELHNENGQTRFTSAIAIPEHHPITRAMLSDASREDGLGSFLWPGKVAVSFEIDRAHGVGGWIRPGDTVALFRSSRVLLDGARPVKEGSRLLFPSLFVIAVDRERVGQNREKAPEASAEPFGASMGALPQESSVLTVLANPAEASGLIAAREEGAISVALRAPGDEVPWREGR